MEKLRPEDNDIVIIGSAEDRKTAEMAAKNAALQTVSEHEKALLIFYPTNHPNFYE